jgi:hypothetical protein
MTEGTWDRKGVFSFPDGCRDLIDLFLTPPMRKARRKIHNQIDNRNMTPLAKKVTKTVVNIQALSMQARQNQQQSTRQVGRR